MIIEQKTHAAKKDIAGLVIAGGMATRLGTPKHKALLCGRPLLSRVIDRLAPQVDIVAVNLKSAMPDSQFPVLVETQDGQGPLAAVHLGLNWAKGEGAAYLVTMPVDVPFFPLDFVAMLYCAGPHDAPCFAVASGHAQGLCAIWPTAQLGAFETHFTVGGVRTVHRMHDLLNSKAVSFTSVGNEQFMNINTPDDLARAEAYCI